MTTPTEQPDPNATAWKKRRIKVKKPSPSKASQDWTADKVLMMGCDTARAAYRIADAHNASIAAAFRASASNLKFEAEDELNQ